MSRSFVIVTAAGFGTRLQADSPQPPSPKALIPIERPMLDHALAKLPACDGVVVSAPQDYLAEFETLTGKALRQSAAAGAAALVVPGGASRQASVHAALGALVDSFEMHSTDLVVIHDAARALTPKSVFIRVFDALADYPVVIPGIPVADTIKTVVAPGADPAKPAGSHPANPESGVETVLRTLARDQLRAIQTPQGFHLETLVELHERFAERERDETCAFGDDAAMAEEAGIPVSIVAGDVLAFKITTPADLELAKTLVRKSS